MWDHSRTRLRQDPKFGSGSRLTRVTEPTLSARRIGVSFDVTRPASEWSLADHGQGGGSGGERAQKLIRDDGHFEQMGPQQLKDLGLESVYEEVDKASTA